MQKKFSESFIKIKKCKYVLVRVTKDLKKKLQKKKKLNASAVCRQALEIALAPKRKKTKKKKYSKKSSKSKSS